MRREAANKEIRDRNLRERKKSEEEIEILDGEWVSEELDYIKRLREMSLEDMQMFARI